MITFSDIHNERAFFHSPLSFIRNQDELLTANFYENIINGVRKNTIQVSGSKARCFFKYLEWDSKFINYPTYRIEFVDWDKTITDPLKEVTQTILDLKKELSARHSHYYLFAEIPSEDLVMIQALGGVGFKLIETRLTYFHDNIAEYSWPHRYSVRQATDMDIPNLRTVAMEARNNFDRLHADAFFSDGLADSYLGTYIENSIKGFSDLVLVPDEVINGSNLPGAFFAGDLISQQKSPLGISSGSIVLTAAGPSRRGWHLKLMSEMCLHFQQQGVQLVYMKTQPTNRAVIRNCEKLDWKYGNCTHIFATHT